MTAPDDPMNTTVDDRSADGPDPDLVNLPPPRRPFRRLTLMTLSLTAVAAVGMIVGLSSDLGYAMTGRAPVEVGALSELKPAANLRNSWVRGDGEVAPIGGIRFD